MDNDISSPHSTIHDQSDLGSALFFFQKAVEVYTCPHASFWSSLCGFHGHAVHRCIHDPLADPDAL